MFTFASTTKSDGFQKYLGILLSVFAIAAICSIPETIRANDDTGEEASESKQLRFTVYAWNCSRSLSEAGRFESLEEACGFAAQEQTRSRNVRVIQGQLKQPYDILGYRDSIKPIEYLVCNLNDVDQWRVVGRLEKAEHANLLAESFKVEENERPRAFVVHRFE